MSELQSVYETNNPVPSIECGSVVYEPVKKLGYGATSVVYEATIKGQDERVALKVMKPNIPEAMQEAFFEEADILRALNIAEKKRDDGINSTPRIGRVKREGEHPFIEIELVEGTPLRDLYSKPPYYLEEEQALSIFNQLARVLDILHTDLKRSYTDLQPGKNLIVSLNEGSTPSIKILDWNHVSRRGKGDYQRDLGVTASFLYNVLTGKNALIKGETERVLEKRAGERWYALSLGTRRLVQKALHPNPNKRFQSAREFREAIEWLEGNRNKTSYQLLSDITNELSSTDDLLGVERAEILFDLVDQTNLSERKQNLLNALQDKIYEKKSENLLSWDAVEIYYKVGNYQKAANKGREIAKGTGRLEQWRLVTVAEAGDKMSSGEYNGVWKGTADMMIEAMNRGDYQSARTLIEDKQDELKLDKLPEEIVRLYAEVQARLNYLEAQRAEEIGDLIKASKYYKIADKFRQKIPYRKYFDMEEGWEADLDKYAAKLASRGAKTEKDGETLNEIIVRFRNEDCIENNDLKVIEQILREDPENIQAIKLCYRLSHELLLAGDLDTARAVIEKAVFFGAHGQVETAEKLLEIIHRIQGIKELLTKGDIYEAVDKALQLKGELSQGQAYMLKLLKGVISTTRVRALIRKDFDKKVLDELYHELFPETVGKAEEAEEITQQDRVRKFEQDLDRLREENDRLKQELNTLRKKNKRKWFGF